MNARFDVRTVASVTVALGALLFGAAAPAQAADRYKIDPAHFTVAFMVDHIGYARTLGFFRDVSGSFSYDEGSRALSEVSIEISTESVFTNHARRDKHLRGKDFLKANKFPKMTFESSKVTAADDQRYQIDGMLTLLGKSKPVTVMATRNKMARYPFDGEPEVVGVSATATFKRSDFGMNYAVDNGWVGDDVEVIIEFEARKQ